MEVVFDLSGLPSQLLRHIAVFSNEVDIPHVRATCRELRAAMDDPLFRQTFTVVLTRHHLSSSSLARIMRSRLMKAVTVLDVRTLDAKLPFTPAAGFQLPHLECLLFHIQHKSFAAKLGGASPKLTRVTVAGAPEDNQTQALLNFPHMTSLAVNSSALRRPDVFKQLGRQLVHLDLHGSWIQTGAQRLSLVLLTQLTGLVGLSITKEALQAAGALQLPASLQHVEGQSGSFALLPGLLSYRMEHLTSLSFWLPLPTPGAPTSLAPLGCLHALQNLSLISPIASEIQVRLADLAPLTACSRLTSLTADVLLVPSEGGEAAAAGAAPGGAAAGGGGGGQGGVRGSNGTSSSSIVAGSSLAPLAFSSSSRRSLVPLTSLRRLDVGHLGYLRSDFPLSTPFPHITHLVWSEFEDLGDPSPAFNDQVDLLSGLTGLRQLDTNMACMLRLLRQGTLVNGGLTGLQAVRLETVLPEGIEDLFPALPLLPGLTQLELYTWERHTSSWEANYRQEEDLNLWHLQANLRSLKLRASHIVGGLFTPSISAPHLLTSCLPQLSELVFEDCEALTADLLNQLLFGLSRARAAAEVAASWEGCHGGSSSGGGSSGGCGSSHELLEGLSRQQQGSSWTQGNPAAAAAAAAGGGGGVGAGSSAAGAAIAAAAAAAGAGVASRVLAPLCVRVTGIHQLGNEARGRLVRQLSEGDMALGDLAQHLQAAATAIATVGSIPAALQMDLLQAAAAEAAQEGVESAFAAAVLAELQATAGEGAAFAAAVQLAASAVGGGGGGAAAAAAGGGGGVAGMEQPPQQQQGPGPPVAGTSQQQQQQQGAVPQRHSPTRVRGELAVVGTPLGSPQAPPGQGASSSRGPAVSHQAGGPGSQQQQQQQQQGQQQLGSPHPPYDVRTPSPQQELLLAQLRQHMRLLDEGRGLQQQQQQGWRSQQVSPDQPPSKRHHMSPQQHTPAAAPPAATAGPAGVAEPVEGSQGAAPGGLLTQQANNTDAAAAAAAGGGGGGAAAAAGPAAAAGGGGGDISMDRPGTPLEAALGVAALQDRYFEGFYVIRPGLWLEVAPQVPLLGAARRPETPQG